jgi:hypothetical protein
MRIQVQIPGLDCLANEVKRAAKALEDIRDMLKENADAATVAALEADRTALQTSSDDLAASVAAASDPKP